MTDNTEHLCTTFSSSETTYYLLMDWEHAEKELLYAGCERAYSVSYQLSYQIIQVVSFVSVVEWENGRMAALDKRGTRFSRVLQFGKSQVQNQWHTACTYSLFPRQSIS